MVLFTKIQRGRKKKYCAYKEEAYGGLDYVLLFLVVVNTNKCQLKFGEKNSV